MQTASKYSRSLFIPLGIIYKTRRKETRADIHKTSSSTWKKCYWKRLTLAFHLMQMDWENLRFDFILFLFKNEQQPFLRRCECL